MQASCQGGAEGFDARPVGFGKAVGMSQREQSDERWARVTQESYRGALWRAILAQNPPVTLRHNGAYPLSGEAVPLELAVQGSSTNP